MKNIKAHFLAIILLLLVTLNLLQYNFNTSLSKVSTPLLNSLSTSEDLNLRLTKEIILHNTKYHPSDSLHIKLLNQINYEQPNSK
jgi:hypothetical protein